MVKARATILVLAFSDLSRDTRIRRHLAALCSNYTVTAVGNADPKMEHVRYIPTGFHEKTPVERAVMYSAMLLGRFETAYWYPHWLKQLRKTLSENTYDVIMANDIDTLPLAACLQSRHGILLDAHEYAPRQFEQNPIWRLLFGRLRQYQCKTYLPKAKQCVTVAPGLADEYEKQFGVPFRVLTNAAIYREGLASSPVGNERVDLVHHGAALPSRDIGIMIEMMRYTEPRFHLHFYLVENPQYVAHLKAQAKDLSTVHFHAPVKADEIVEEINQYDIGLQIIKGVNYNQKHMLTNKFFEFVQARLAIAIGPSVEMAPYVSQYKLGIVCPSFEPEEMAERLNKLTAADIAGYKINSAKAAEALSANKNAKMLLDIVQKMQI